MRSLAQSFNFPHFGRAQISLRTRTSRISGCHLVPEKRANDQVDQARVVLFTPSPPSSSVFFFLLSLQFARIQNVVKIPRTGYFLIQKSLV